MKTPIRISEADYNAWLLNAETVEKIGTIALPGALGAVLFIDCGLNGDAVSTRVANRCYLLAEGEGQGDLKEWFTRNDSIDLLFSDQAIGQHKECIDVLSSTELSSFITVVTSPNEYIQRCKHKLKLAKDRAAELGPDYRVSICIMEESVVPKAVFTSN